MGLSAHWADTQRRKIDRFLMAAPVICSLLALTLVVASVVKGVPRQADEGTAAHLFQLLIAAQAPLVIGFAAVSDWKRPARPLLVLAVQALAFAAALGSLTWAGY